MVLLCVCMLIFHYYRLNSVRIQFPGMDIRLFIIKDLRYRLITRSFKYFLIFLYSSEAIDLMIAGSDYRLLSMQATLTVLFCTVLGDNSRGRVMPSLKRTGYINIYIENPNHYRLDFV